MNTVIARSLVPCIAVAALAGCGSLGSGSKPEVLVDRAGIDVIAADASRQFTYFKDAAAKERFCRGPGPDFSVTASSGVNLGLPIGAGGVGDIGGGSTRGSLDLGGRSPAILIARELLYRACELSANTNADPATERAIYAQFLAALVEIAKAQTGPGAAGVAATSAMPALPGAVPRPPATIAPAPVPADPSITAPSTAVTPVN